MIESALHILFLILFIYLSLNILYLFIVAVVGHFAIKKNYPPSKHKNRIAILITAYQEDNVIVQTVQEVIKHDYPRRYFEVFVAAHALQPSTILRLRQLNAQVHEVSFSSGSKAKSLNYLLNTIDERNYDIALILDSDNIMLPGFLEKVNAAFQAGYKAVQGHRAAKNLNTPVAILDALSEEVNNHLFRKAQGTLGFSASLIGSGMAFEFSKLKQVYNKPGIIDNPACDREVDFEMLRSGIRILYLDDALLLDEKVASDKVYTNQRRRWLESQLMHVGLFFSNTAPVKIKTKDYWNKLFINLIPPRIFFLAMFFCVFIVYLVQYILDADITGMPVYAWLGMFILYALSIAIAIPRRYYNRHTLKAIIHLPIILLSLLRAAATMRLNRKEFVHTPKTYTGPKETTK